MITRRSLKGISTGKFSISFSTVSQIHPFRSGDLLNVTLWTSTQTLKLIFALGENWFW